MSKGGTTRIEDALLEPYFVKIVNGNYEIHKKHTPKNGGQPYEKFVAVKTSMLNAVGAIAKHKLSVRRKTKKVMMLADYVAEIKEMRKMVEMFLDDDSVERKITKLENKVSLLEAELKKLKVKTQEAGAIDLEL